MSKVAVVVGAGPVGVGVAGLLAKELGYTVHVFERGTREDVEEITEKYLATRAFGMSIRGYAEELLSRIGGSKAIELFLELGYQREATVTVTPGPNGRQMVSKKSYERFPVMSILRPELMKVFLTTIDREQTSWQGKVVFHFETEVLSLNLEDEANQSAEVQDVKSSEKRTVSADLIVAADGIGSKQGRAALSKVVPSFKADFQSSSSSQRCMLCLECKRWSPKWHRRSLYMFVPANMAKDAAVAVRVHRNESQGVIISLWANENTAIFECTTGAALKELLLKSFPTDVQGLVTGETPFLTDEMLDAIVKRRDEWWPQPKTLKVSHLAYGCTALLGDAASAMPPTIGQGLMAGCHSAMLLVDGLAAEETAARTGRSNRQVVMAALKNRFEPVALREIDSVQWITETGVYLVPAKSRTASLNAKLAEWFPNVRVFRTPASQLNGKLELDGYQRAKRRGIHHSRMLYYCGALAAAAAGATTVSHFKFGKAKETTGLILAFVCVACAAMRLS